MNEKIKLVASSILTLCVFYMVATFAKNVIIKLGVQKAETEKMEKNIDHVSIMYSQFAFFVYYLILLIGLSFILPKFGVQKETIFALLGSIVIAIGISLQSVLSNMWCGMLIMVNNIYNVGDVITIKLQNIDGDFTGQITSVNLFYTKLAERGTGSEITISNYNLYTSVLVNSSIHYA